MFISNKKTLENLMCRSFMFIFAGRMYEIIRPDEDSVDVKILNGKNAGTTTKMMYNNMLSHHIDFYELKKITTI